MLGFIDSHLQARRPMGPLAAMHEKAQFSQIFQVTKRKKLLGKSSFFPFFLQERGENQEFQALCSQSFVRSETSWPVLFLVLRSKVENAELYMKCRKMRGQRKG